jgi:predicted porin
MKRTLIIAALTTLAAGATLAQSSVTIYGRLNTTVEAQANNGVKIKKLVNNSSRLGFKGTEDLGGGLKANFILEHGFGSDDGTAPAPFWGRQSELNLQGGFGTVRLGNFTSEAYFATSDYIGFHNHETGTSSDAFYAYLGRNGNKVAYRSPELGGFTAEAAVSAGEGAGRVRNYDLALNYGIGPVHLGFGYEKAAGKAKQMAFSAMYDGGALLLGAMLQRDTDGFGAGTGKRTNVRASAAYIMGSSEFHINVGSAGKYSNVADSAAKQFTLGYNYNLSKRTKVYGYYTKINDGKAQLYTANGSNIGKKGDFSSIAGGVRHNF